MIVCDYCESKYPILEWENEFFRYDARIYPPSIENTFPYIVITEEDHDGGICDNVTTINYCPICGESLIGV